MNIYGGPTLGQALYQVVSIQNFAHVFGTRLFSGENSLHLVENIKLKT